MWWAIETRTVPVDPSIEYKLKIEQKDHEIDSLNKLLITNSDERAKLLEGLQHLIALEKKSNDLFNKNYNNIINGSVSNDSICRFITKAIYSNR